MATHQGELGAFAHRYVSFRDRLEGLVLGAVATKEAADFVDPRLNFSGLHGSAGLYLRLTRREAKTAEGIRSAGTAMRQDSFIRCLGMSPASARSLLRAGRFLEPTWRDEVEQADSVIKLRVLDDSLARRTKVDVPVVAELLQSQYFLVLVQDGSDISESTASVFLWNLATDALLLRTTVKPRGTLIAARVAFGGASPSRAQLTQERLSESSAGAECALAAHVKEVANGSRSSGSGAARAAL